MKPSDLHLLLKFLAENTAAGDANMTLVLEARRANLAKEMMELLDEWVDAAARLELHRCIRELKSRKQTLSPFVAELRALTKGTPSDAHNGRKLSDPKKHRATKPADERSETADA